MSISNADTANTSKTNSGKSLKIVQLYPCDMNIYGDWGNTLSLSRRAKAHGFEVEIVDYHR